MHQIQLEHTTDTGHRIPGHEGGLGKCARLHGHTYRFQVALAAETLDITGFVIDFGEIKRILDEWDHRTLLWEKDGLSLAVTSRPAEEAHGVIRVPFIPTAENMAEHLVFRFLSEFAQLTFVSVCVHETAKTEAKFYASQSDLARLAERSDTQ